ncbi:hypothetical protein [Tateyamaria sp. Alg231-49]|uniref:hypothetical protein n=1 Tax=Tateyamaria sp. Alg231-49 TaxID=1922219 RepID=UPI000D5500E9|nr:hypothetical protein [Tateyamaria sp. Alg231-49]
MLLFSIPAYAQVSDWEYKGIQNRGTIAEAVVAEASVNQSKMELIYFTNGDKLQLWFTYVNPERFFHPGYNAQAEVFIRTREGLGMSGRYESDYLVKGEITVQPDSKGMPQFIVVDLTEGDLAALVDNEKNNVMGAGYFAQDEVFRTTTFPTKGFSAAAKRILRDVAEMNGSTTNAPSVPPQGTYSATAKEEATFNHCADLFSQATAYKASWDSYKADEPALKAMQSKLKRALAEDEAEVVRLEKILKIMQDSEEVRAKYHRAYDRYKRTHGGVEEFHQEASALFDKANNNRQKSDRTWDRISNECPNELNTQFLQAQCSPGDKRYRAICASFGQ